MFASGDVLRTAVSLCGMRRTIANLGLILLVAAWIPTGALAQSTARGRYYPLDQRTAPGVAGQWAGVQRDFIPAMQPVRFELPGDDGQVSIFTAQDGESAALAAPAIAGLRVGSLYRIKISNLAEFPGVELYPTIELLDRLHPPRGREIEFAIPITFTAEEISSALDGRLVTKVVYLEQPDRADPVRNSTAARTRPTLPQDNLLAIADEAGRPMVIVRLGGRVPDAATPSPGFYGMGAPVQIFEQPARAGEPGPR